MLNLKNKKWIILLIIVSVILLLCAAALFIIFSDINGSIRDDGEIAVEIPKGAGTAKISEMLGEKGVVRFPLIFRLYSRYKKADGKYNYGTFTLNKGMKYDEIITMLQGVAEKKESIKFTITEGEETKQIIDKLVSKGIGAEERFIDVINNHEFDYEFLKGLTRTDYRLEGYLFPDTYEVFVGESEESVIKRILDNFDKKTKDLQIKVSEEGESLDDIIIMASIVEREGKKREELPIVASVFYNRIRDNIMLESCATVQYILPQRREILLTEDTKIDNPYNTYKYSGLPPGPIANPGIEAISAAVSPAKSDYFFFVAKKDGSHLFAKTYAQHKKNCDIALH